jgi:aspartate oxidase
MLTVAQIIIKSAINRKESRGAHSRSDYKEKYANSTHSNIIKNNKELIQC